MKLPAVISSGRLLPASVSWIYVCVCLVSLPAATCQPDPRKVTAPLFHRPLYQLLFLSIFSLFIYFLLCCCFCLWFFFSLVKLKMSPLHLGAIPIMCTFCYAVLVIKLTNKRSRPNTFLRLRFLKTGDPSLPAPNTWGNKKWSVSRSVDLHNHIRRPFGLISLVCATFGRRGD